MQILTIKSLCQELLLSQESAIKDERETHFHAELSYRRVGEEETITCNDRANDYIFVVDKDTLCSLIDDRL
jgi:hypothetical protein